VKIYVFIVETFFYSFVGEFGHCIAKMFRIDIFGFDV